jgi:predicted nucleotidyltransferase
MPSPTASWCWPPVDHVACVGGGEVLNSTESAQVQSILQLVDDVFGDDMPGAYLHGSAVLGGLRPTSDLDILVVLKRRTSAAERRALVEGLLDVSGARARRGPARPVELSVVVENEVRPWRYRPARSSCTASGYATPASRAGLRSQRRLPTCPS